MARTSAGRGARHEAMLRLSEPCPGIGKSIEGLPEYGAPFGRTVYRCPDCYQPTEPTGHRTLGFHRWWKR